MRNSTLVNHLNDPYEPRYMNETGLIPRKIKEWGEMSVLTAARLGWQSRDNELKRVSEDNIKSWLKIPEGQLRPDATPDTPVGLGAALWEIIVGATP